MLTCYIKYMIDPDKLEEFSIYANAWITLIEKYGGSHQGYYWCNDELNKELNSNFSFPELAKPGESNIAIALFSFADINTYDNYKNNVKNDPLCTEATALLLKSKCFLSYERTFLTPLSPLSAMVITNDALNIENELRAREPIFHRSNQGTTREEFANMIVDDFWEVGASGNIYTREYVLDILEQRYKTPGYVKNDVWKISAFKCQQLSPIMFLVTYLLSQGQEKRLTRRSTLWKWENGQWKAQYHQGTICAELTT